MGARARQCPMCEDRTTIAEICPIHSVPTIDVGMFDLAPVAINIGTVIAHRYRVERFLDVGGMGTVLIAVQIGMNRTVALKILRGLQAVDMYLVKRFYREAQAIASLNHPNIVQVFDFGFDQNVRVPFLAMELIEGSTLDNIVHKGRLTEKRAASIFAQVAKALYQAHGAGIIHRDLKPANIMVTRLRDGEEHVKVLDFGVAKILSNEREGLTAPGITVGSPHYMSPEQAKADPVDFRSDLYSLGCVLYEALSGRAPFDAERTIDVMRKQVNEPAPVLPPRLADGRSPSPAMAELALTLLAKAPDDRPANGAVVARILAAIARGEAIDVGRELRIERDIISTPRSLDGIPKVDSHPEFHKVRSRVGIASDVVEPVTLREMDTLPEPYYDEPVAGVFDAARSIGIDAIDPSDSNDSNDSIDDSDALETPQGMTPPDVPVPPARKQDHRGASARMLIEASGTLVAAPQGPPPPLASSPWSQPAPSLASPLTPVMPAVKMRGTSDGAFVPAAAPPPPVLPVAVVPESRPQTVPLVRVVHEPSLVRRVLPVLVLIAGLMVVIAGFLLLQSEDPTPAPDPPVAPALVSMERAVLADAAVEPEHEVEREREAAPAVAPDAGVVAPPARSAVHGSAPPAKTREVATVLVISDPPGAEVLRDRTLVGRTPCPVAKPRGQELVRLTVRKKGFVERKLDLDAKSASEVRLKLMEEW